MKITHLLIVIIFAFTGCINQTEIKNNDIKTIMQQQQEDWNNGDLDRFMNAYWNSDSLIFIGSKGITYGWNTTLSNYKKSYKSKEQMGTLQFTIHKIEVLDNNAFVIGKWEIERTNDSIGGHFTLFWKYIDNEWKIVADHTS